MVDNIDIQQSLKILGFDSIESIIYTNLIQKGELSLLDLSRIIGVPRSTVYRKAQTLIEKNFAEWIVGDRGKKIRATEPQRLEYLIDDKKNELDIFSNALSTLKKFNIKPESLESKTQLRYYTGVEGLKQMMWNTLSADKEVYGYTIYGRIEALGTSFVNKYDKEFRRRGLKDKVLINKKIVPRALRFVNKQIGHQEYEDIKVLTDPNFYISGDTTFYNDIYAVCFWKEEEVVGFEIENPEIVKMQKGIFKILWKNAIKLSEYIKTPSNLW
jgi:sugar-specific transcriptional regulator TrmB